MLRYSLVFAAGCAATIAAFFFLVPRASNATVQKRGSPEVTVTIHVEGSPRALIPFSSIPSLLGRITGLSEAEKKTILDQVTSGFITELQLVGDESGRLTSVTIPVNGGALVISDGQSDLTPKK